MKFTKPNKLISFTFCTQTSLCTAEHIFAHAFPAYPHILYTDITVHSKTYLCPSFPCISTHSVHRLHFAHQNISLPKLSVHIHKFCTQTSLCRAEHIFAHGFPAYPHILYTDFTVHSRTYLYPCFPYISTYSVHRLHCAQQNISLPIPSQHIHTFSGMCRVTVILWHLVWLKSFTTGWPYPFLYLPICWNGWWWHYSWMVPRHRWHSDWWVS
jgi:hypothetical protein